MTVSHNDYVATPLGEVHVRRTGAGPALVLLHDMPGSSLALDVELVRALSLHRTVIAPDLIGAGATTVNDAAAGDLDRQAAAMAHTLTALGLRDVPVVGDGAGAAVALRMAALYPDLVRATGWLSDPSSGDGVEAPEKPALPTPDASGTHLLQLFDEVRNSFMFRPWWDPRKESRRSRALPGPEVLHELFLDTVAHGSAHRDLADAAAAYWSELESVPAGPLDVDAILALPGGALDETTTRGRTARTYVDTSIGQVHLRLSGDFDSGQRPVLLLHANPGSGASLEPLGLAVGASRPTIVWDTPGHGRSAAVPADVVPTMADTYAPLLVEVLDGLGIERCDVYGTHTGAALAAEFAIVAPDRVGAVVLDGVPLFDDDPELVRSVMAHYFIDLTPDTHGSHIRRAWGASADMALWWPWFNHTVDGIRTVNAYATDFLHGVVVDMLRSAPYYYRFYQAGWRWLATDRLPLVRRPVMVGSTLTDPLAPMTPRALALLGEGTTTVVFHPLGRAESVGGNAALIIEYLDQHTP